jgi:hypothetical protein
LRVVQETSAQLVAETTAVMRLSSLIFLTPVALLLIALPVKRKDPVFKGLNQTQITQLHSILFNLNFTRAEIKRGVKQWVSTQNSTIQVCTLRLV